MLFADFENVLNFCNFSSGFCEYTIENFNSRSDNDLFTWRIDRSVGKDTCIYVFFTMLKSFDHFIIYVFVLGIKSLTIVNPTYGNPNSISILKSPLIKYIDISCISFNYKIPEDLLGVTLSVCKF